MCLFVSPVCEHCNHINGVCLNQIHIDMPLCVCACMRVCVCKGSAATCCPLYLVALYAAAATRGAALQVLCKLRWLKAAPAVHVQLSSWFCQAACSISSAPPSAAYLNHIDLCDTLFLRFSLSVFSYSHKLIEESDGKNAN